MAQMVDIYAPVFEKASKIRLSSSDPYVPTFVTANLSQTSDPKTIFETRVQGRHILLENPVKESRAKKELNQKRENRKRDRERKKVALGALNRKNGGRWRLDPSQSQFDLFIPLHHLWMGYMSELLGLPESNASLTLRSAPATAGMHAKLVKADFHGSIVTVHQSKNKDLEGLSGIVIHETEGTFRVITRQNRVRLLPKQNSIFKLAIPFYAFKKDQGDAKLATVLDNPHLDFELYGNQFRFRAADRASKKFKPKETIEL